MQNGLLRPAALLTGASLALVGCTPLSPRETGGPGPFAGANGAAAASSITRSTNSVTGESFSTGASINTAAFATITIIAKHQASQRQLEVAKQRARAAVAHLAAAPRHTTKPGAPAPKAKRVPRYIAVETVKDEHTAPTAQRAVMIWDTQTQEMVGNNVYDIANPPPVGATSRFETYSAEYVGAGL